MDEDPKNVNDKTIIEKLQSSNDNEAQQGWDILYRKYHERLYKALRKKFRKLWDDPICEDLINETFIVVCTNIKARKYNHDNNLYGYCYRIGFNTFNNYLRSQNRKPVAYGMINPEIMASDWQNQFEGFSSKTTESEKKYQILSDCIDTVLNNDEKRLLRLRYTEDIKQKELAEQENLSDGAMKQKFFRIRKKLNNCKENHKTKFQ